MEAHLKRVDVHFEFCQKLGIEFYCFHDRDVSPEGGSIAETEANFDVIVDKLEQKQKETGVQLLWGTCNLFSHKRYMNGACTNPDPDVVAMAAAQVKKCLEVTKRLGGANFVMWGGRDGYQCLLNTDYKVETDNYATFLRMTADYADKIGFTGQLLLEPKPREPTAHQYNFDAETTLGFLDHHGAHAWCTTPQRPQTRPTDKGHRQCTPVPHGRRHARLLHFLAMLSFVSAQG